MAVLTLSLSTFHSGWAFRNAFFAAFTFFGSSSDTAFHSSLSSGVTLMRMGLLQTKNADVQRLRAPAPAQHWGQWGGAVKKAADAQHLPPRLGGEGTVSQQKY